MYTDTQKQDIFDKGVKEMEHAFVIELFTP